MKVPSGARREKICRECGYKYLGDDVELAFRARKTASNCSPKLRRVCRLCEQDNRTARKRENKWRVKTRRTRREHAKKLGIAAKVLDEKFGWEVDRMAHEAEYEYHNGCSECGESYESMTSGLGDITLDVIDRRVEPLYGFNTRWVCKTCNLAKGTLLPEQWAKIKRLWRERAQFLKRQALVPKLRQLGFKGLV